MIGVTLQNRYRLDAELGRGGMGVVYRAHDNLLDRPVAVKMLSRAGLGTEGRARLLREARAAAQLDHPNIVSVYDAGESDGTPFIVMQLVEGQSLRDRPLQSPDAIADLALQICAALEHAHAHGIIHRDLKPENILLAADGTAKLMDFGLARTGASRQTSEAAVAGTVFYMAPEQALGQPISARTDLYALGVVLYELVAGRLPFTADDPLGVLSQHLHAPVVPPSAYNPEVSPALERIILKLLAKNAADRFASAREVVSALNEAGPTERPHHNLPLLLSRFIGREREVEAVARLLQASRLVTLTGAGGSGKTRLALQVAGGLLETFPDGVWLVELAALSDPTLVPQAVTSALNLREQRDRPQAETLVEYLRSRHVLLVLDNCEHLIEACARLVDTLLRACPRLSIMAASREAMGLTGEHAFSVPALSIPHPHDLPLPGEHPLAALSQYEAVRLFQDRAAAVQPSFKLSDQNAPTVAQICHRLDGMPLAIELAAARLKTLSLEQIAARLDDRFNLLTVGSRTALPRHQTLRATMDWSYDLLSETERLLFRRLAVFAGNWPLEAAEQVTSDQVSSDQASSVTLSEPSARDTSTLDTLTRLVDKSLALVESGSGEARYRFLETVRQYALEKLQESGEVEVMQTRHLEFFLGLGDRAEPELRGPEQVAWLDRLQVERHNLRAALDWSLRAADDPDGQARRIAGLRLAGNVYRFWYLRGYWREGHDWLEQLLAAGGEGGDELPTPRTLEARALTLAKSRALQGLGWLADETRQAKAPYELSLALCRQIEDKWGVAYSLRGLGALLSNQNDNAQAARLLTESLDLFRELGDTWGIALARFNLGWVAAYQDDPQQARALWEESQSLFRQAGDRWGLAVTLGSLGFAARLQGDYRRAIELSRESLALFQELGDKAGIAISLARLGNVAFRRDDLKQAAALLEEGLALQRKLGYRSDVANSIVVLGQIACYQGDYRQAITRIEEGLGLFRESDDRWGIAFALDSLAFVAYFQGAAERAAALWEDSLGRFRDLADRSGMASTLNGLGQVAHRSGDYRRAATLLEESLVLSRQARDKPAIAASLNSLGRLEFSQGKTAQAATLFQESLTLRGELKAKRGIAESIEGLAGAAAADRQPERAARLFGAAEALREVTGVPMPPVERDDYERSLAGAQAGLSEETFAAAWAEGRAMTMDQSIAYALEESRA